MLHIYYYTCSPTHLPPRPCALFLVPLSEMFISCSTISLRYFVVCKRIPKPFFSLH